MKNSLFSCSIVRDQLDRFDRLRPLGMRDRENVVHVKLAIVFCVVEQSAGQEFLHFAVVFAEKIILARDQAYLKVMIALGDARNVVNIIWKPLFEKYKLRFRCGLL